MEDGAECWQEKRNAEQPLGGLTVTGCLGPVLWANAVVQANLKSLFYSCPCLQPYKLGILHSTSQKKKFYGDFFLSHMWVAKRCPPIKIIFHSSVINAELTTCLLSWNSFWMHKTEGQLGAAWTSHYLIKGHAMPWMGCLVLSKIMSQPATKVWKPTDVQEELLHFRSL